VAAEAHLQAAYEAGGGTVPGGPSVAAAVRHLQAARRASPIATRAHARLGLLAGQFVGEPARVHFDRAKRLWPADPEVFYAAGREALGRGDTAAALADWQRSLAGSPARLGDILKAVKGVPADELRRELVPDLAAAQVIAADALFPDRLRQADDRRPFLVDAVRLAEANDGPTAADWAAAAKAADELRRPDAADSCWQRAAAAAPKDVAIRDGYARWLEREERWEAAVEQLRELQKLAGVASVQDRIEGCYHALKLKRLIGD
jgi:tetratricopeptide (TPR) repeat protein